MKPAIPFDRFASDHFHPSANNNFLVNEIYALAVSSSTYGNPSCVMMVRKNKHLKYLLIHFHACRKATAFRNDFSEAFNQDFFRNSSNREGSTRVNYTMKPTVRYFIDKASLR